MKVFVLLKALYNPKKFEKNDKKSYVLIKMCNINVNVRTNIAEKY